MTGKMGFIFIGVLFAFPEMETVTFLKLSLLYALCLFLGLAIYSTNSYFGYKTDLSNDRLAIIHSSSKINLGIYAFLFTIMTVALLYFFSWEIRFTAISMVIIWGIYAWPRIGLKSIPVVGLVVAFVAQLAHFHLGYLMFENLSSDSMLIAIYFALLFTAGHALHEVIDFEADRKVQLNTSAVYFGKDKLENLSIIIFALAAVFWVIIYLSGVINLFQCISYILAFLLQLASWKVVGENKFLYRKSYLLYYFIATMAIVIEHYWIW
jgi:4-hydroxybenzoate polyprenyltransferase